MTTRKVAIITGASGGIGAGLVAGYRKRNWAVVASSRTIKRSQEPDLVAVAGDIAEPATAGRIVDTFLESSPFITGEILHIDGGQVAGHSEALG